MGRNHIWELDGTNAKIVDDWGLPERLTEDALCSISDHLVAYCEESEQGLSAVTYDFRQSKINHRIRLERGWWIEEIAASPSGKTLVWIEQFDVARAPEMRQLAKVTVARVKALTLADGTVLRAEILLSDPGMQSFSSISVAADETTIAVGGHVGAKALHLLDMKTAKELWNSNKTSVETLAFTPDGKSLFTCNNIGEVTRWDTKTGKELSTWTLLNEDPAIPKPVPDLARAVRVSPDGTMVSAATFRSHRLVVWDIETGKVHQDWRLPKLPIESASDFASDSKSIWFSYVSEKAVHRKPLLVQK